jgi:hypothetical protein
MVGRATGTGINDSRSRFVHRDIRHLKKTYIVRQLQGGHDGEAVPTAELLFDECGHRNVLPMNISRSRGRKKSKDRAPHILQL